MRTISMLLLVAACGVETHPQVIVSIDAEPSVQARARWIRVLVIDNEGMEQFRETLPLRGDGAVSLPHAIPPLAAQGAEANRRFTIESELFDTEAAPSDETAFNRLRARSTFEDGALTYLRLVHTESCDNVTCDGGQTCQQGRCVGACVQSSSDEESVARPECSECETCGERATCDALVLGTECGCGEQCDGAGSCQLRGSVQSIALGDEHTCARTGGRDLYCWGSNESGQLTSTSPGGPTPILSFMGSLEHDAGAAFTCSVSAMTQHVLCWGDNGSRRLGVDDFSNRNEPVEVAYDADFQAVATGTRHACALTGSQEVVCWGSCKRGQTGPSGGSGDDCGPGATQLPILVPLAEPAVQVCAGNTHSCARLEGGGIDCWGHNENGEVGDIMGLTDHPEPYRLSFSGTENGFTQLSCGGFHNCAITPDRALYCWGGSSQGNTGRGTTDEDQVGGRVGEAEDLRVVDVACGLSGCCAIEAETLGLWCWGGNVTRQVGSVDASPTHLVPVPVAPGMRWQTLALGDGHSCAVEENGAALWCWGDNSSGQVGPGLSDIVPQPRRVCVPE